MLIPVVLLAIILPLLRAPTIAKADVASPSVPNIIWDTDIGADCDDAADLALLNRLADLGECNILACGAVITQNNGDCARNIEIGLNYYGHFSVPIGILTGETLNDGYNTYRTYIASHYAPQLRRYPAGKAVPNILPIYRQALASAADSSVTMVTSGQLRNLLNLYNSPADAYSALNGHDLIALKCKEIVIAAGTFPATNQSDWNFVSDPVGAQVANSLSYLGSKVVWAMSPGSSTTTDVTNGFTESPLRHSFLKQGCLTRPSWGAVNLLYAIRGLSYDSQQYFVRSSPGLCTVNSSGLNTWTPGGGSQTYTTIGSMGYTALGNLISNLVNVRPRNTPTLISPANGAAVTGSSVTFEWSPVAGAVNYQLMVSRSTSPGVTTGRKLVVRPGNVTSYTDAGYPANGTKYYWWVWACDAEGNWSMGPEVSANGRWFSNTP